VWQRALIVIAGVLAFWIVSAVLFSIVISLGVPTAIPDEDTGGVLNPRVQIAAVAKNSPAESSGIKIGDSIIEIKDSDGKFKPVDKIKETQNLIEQFRGKELTMKMERGKEIFTVALSPRKNPPSGEGPLGVALVRVGLKSYPWWQAPWQGVLTTVNLTGAVILGYGQAIANIFRGLPSGVELMGPVGIVSLFGQFGKLGINYFLQFVGMIAIYIAVFNILPIPAVDGGKLLFLTIEAVRKKPVSPKIEQSVSTVFFGLLILLMIFVTVKDVIRIF